MPIQNPRLIVTAVCGPSQSKRSTSFVGLPIRNVPGGMNTMFVGAAIATAAALLGRLRVARVATSLGGPETIVCHPSTSTHASLTPEEKAAAGVSEGLLRVSVGLEETGDIVADFEQALETPA